MLLISKKFFLLTILLLSLFLNAQRSKKELDSLYNAKVEIPFNKGEFSQALAECKELIPQYEKIGDHTKIVDIYIRMSHLQSSLFQIKESLETLQAALSKRYDINDPVKVSKIYAELGKNYNLLGFRNKAMENYNLGLNVLTNSDEKSLIAKKYIYGLRSVIYEEEKKYNLLYTDLILAHKTTADPYSSSRLAKYYMVYKKNLDSARYYLDLGNRLYKKDITPIFQYSVLLRNQGRYFFETGQNEKAIQYLEESLAISKKLNKPQDIRDTHKILYEVYKAINDQKKSVENLEKYTLIDDSITEKSRSLQEIPIEHFVKEKQVKLEESRDSLVLWLLAVCILFLAVILPLLYRYNKRKKISREIIKTKSKENLILQQKINLALDDVIQLAKKNSPDFWAKFQEAYPEFNNKMLVINPDLKKSELILCAYIFLGFNTKDIAEYSFKALKTIKNNKYNLRKRLNVPTKDDFVVWLRAQLEG